MIKYNNFYETKIMDQEFYKKVHQSQSCIFTANWI